MANQSAKFMRVHRRKMKDLGFKTVQVQLPEKVISYADDFKRINGFSSRGHALAAILMEHMEIMKLEEQATKKAS